jgi:hypothetical protein
VEETLREFTLWWLARVVFTEDHSQWVIATFPISLQKMTCKIITMKEITGPNIEKAANSFEHLIEGMISDNKI